MIKESHFEKNTVIKIFTEKLDYNHLPSGSFDSSLGIIKSDVEDYIKRTNHTTWVQVIKKEYNGNKDAFLKDFLPALSNYVYSEHNIAVKLSPAKENIFIFKKEYPFQLFSAIDFDKKDTKNIFSIISQPIYKWSGEFNRRPDITVFVNGFMLSLLQLKVEQRGQSAELEGRKQIIYDYFAVIKNELAGKFENKDFDELKIKTMKFFHSPIHLISLDPSSGFVIRNMRNYFNETYKLLSEDSDAIKEDNLYKKITKTFFLDSTYTKESHNHLTEAFLYNLYAKENIQKELFFYNYIGRQSAGGKKKFSTAKSVNDILYFPRPNQKYGVDKVIDRIRHLYYYENNLSQLLIDLKEELKLQKIPDDIIKKHIEQEEKRQNIFSILLHYAPGFGKTNIMSWISLMTKSLHEFENDKSFLFDKIFLVSDRLDLKEQMSANMDNMNIEKSLVHEVYSKKSFKKAMESENIRIVILNIHKFNSFKDFLNKKELEQLRENRVCFIIDEIHRTNSGIYHENMKSLFDEIADENNENDKKNLIIGLTATPKQEDLERFGEISISGFAVPFDSYTMQEAIDDGFILDPLIGLQKVAVVMKVVEDENKELATKKAMYENEERISHISAEIVRTLSNYTFKKIDGYGKAMLACNSIYAAKRYKSEINRLFKEESFRKKYPEAKVFIVYSGSNNEKVLEDDLKDEKETIKNFKNIKNGIIIVVDKLQTGFDDPRLHTLFIDKEVSGINAVQLACRVNRTMDGKFDCAVIDFSHENKSADNIRLAFRDYLGQQYTELMSMKTYSDIELNYSKILKTEYVKKFLSIYQKGEESINIPTYQHYVNSLEFDLKKEWYKLYTRYLRDIRDVQLIINIDEKYKENYLIDCLGDFIKKSKRELGAHKGNEAEFYFEDLGYVSLGDLPGFEVLKKEKGSASLSENRKENNDFIGKQKKFNLVSSETEEQIQKRRNKENVLFNVIIEFENVQKEKIGIRLKNNVLSNDKNEVENESNFKDILRMISRKRPDLKEDIQELNNTEMLYLSFKEWVFRLYGSQA